VRVQPFKERGLQRAWLVVLLGSVRVRREVFQGKINEARGIRLATAAGSGLFPSIDNARLCTGQGRPGDS
jgi:hypothetical protein